MTMYAFTLQEIQCFDAVVREGGFQAAAVALNRSHAAIFAAIAKLEANLGVLLLDRSGYRVSLTEAGRSFHRKARSLLGEMEAYIMAHFEAVENVARGFFGDGEVKTGTHIQSYFRAGMHELHPIMDFLCGRGLLEKISQTIRITPKSRLAVEEIAFIMPKV